MTMSKFSEVFIIVRRDRIWSFCMLFRAHFIFWDAMSCRFTLVSEGAGDTPRTWTMEWSDFSCEFRLTQRGGSKFLSAALHWELGWTWQRQSFPMGHCGFREGARDMAMVTWRFSEGWAWRRLLVLVQLGKVMALPELAKLNPCTGVEHEEVRSQLFTLWH